MYDIYERKIEGLFAGQALELAQPWASEVATRRAMPK